MLYVCTQTFLNSSFPSPQHEASHIKKFEKHPCGVCHKDFGENLIYFRSCKKWIHNRCRWVKGRLKSDCNFKCAKCLAGCLVLDDSERIEVAVGSYGKTGVGCKFC